MLNDPRTGRVAPKFAVSSLGKLGTITVPFFPLKELQSHPPHVRNFSQMPRQITTDAHEWINEIPTVPIYYLAKPQPRERTWEN